MGSRPRRSDVVLTFMLGVPDHVLMFMLGVVLTFMLGVLEGRRFEHGEERDREVGRWGGRECRAVGGGGPEDPNEATYLPKLAIRLGRRTPR